jgi:hypothetical protein
LYSYAFIKYFYAVKSSQRKEPIIIREFITRQNFIAAKNVLTKQLFYLKRELGILHTKLNEFYVHDYDAFSLL